MLTSGSLFTGIGGFDLAFQRAGLRCSWQAENDAKCNYVLAHHWPNVRRYGDVRDAGRHNLTAVDVISGGFPCQDVSVAGKRKGLAGERSGLWFEFHRILKELKPRWVVVENVPGLLSSNRGRDFAVILQGLAKLRYGVAWRILDAQYAGVPQRRRRVFIVGSLGDGRAAEVLFESEGVPWNPSPSREEGKRTTPSIKASSPSRRNAGSDPIAGELVIANTVHSREGQRGEPASDQFIAAYNWQSGGDVRHSFGKPSLSANQVPAVGVRRLTPTECERLQGFPDGWTAGQSDTARYRQLGNAVCVPVVEWIARRIPDELSPQRFPDRTPKAPFRT